MSRSDSSPHKHFSSAQKFFHYTAFHQDVTQHAASGHPTTLMTEKTSDTRWIFKQFCSERLAALEVGISYLYRSILLNVPMMRIIQDYDKASQEMIWSEDPDDHSTVIEYPSKISGNASKYYPNFLDLRRFLSGNFSDADTQKLIQQGLSLEAANLLNKTLKEKINFLVTHGLPEAASASLAFQEDDGHLENYGVVGNHVVRIDFDMSLYPHIVSERGVRKNPDASSSFNALTTRDLNNYPILIDTNPYYWFTTYRQLTPSHGLTQEEIKEFSCLQNDSLFIEKSIRTFFKFILIPHSLIMKALPDQNSQNYFVQLQINLRKQFLDSKRCIKWLSAQSTKDIETLIHEFDHFNSSLPPEEKYLNFDLSETYTLFYEILRDANLSYILQICHDLQVMQHQFKINSEQHSFFEKESKQLLNEWIRFCEHTPLEKTHFQSLINTLTTILTNIQTIDQNSSVILPYFKRITELLKLCINQFSNFTFQHGIEPEFTMVITLNHDAQNILIQQVNSWLLNSHHYSEIAQLFEKAHGEYYNEFNPYFTFWTQPKLLNTFQSILDKLKTQDFTNEHPRDLINQLLNQLPYHFSKTLITHYVSLFKAQPLSSQLKQNPMLYAFLQSHPVSELMNTSLLENFTRFIIAAVFTEHHVGEWTMVELVPQT